MRLLFIQYGDYREAFNRFQQGLPEVYYAQKFTVDWVSQIAKKIETVSVMCVNCDRYSEILSNGIRVFGFNINKQGHHDICKAIEKYKPSHLICCSPILSILRLALKNKIKTLPLFADSFERSGIRSKIRNYFLATLLNNKDFNFVGNHNINASRALQKIGVHPNKIIPWDFPPMITPDQYPCKSFPPKMSPIKLIYVGSLLLTKGVLDAIESTQNLLKKKQDVLLSIVGPGDQSIFLEKVKTLDIEKNVTFYGRVPHEKVTEMMHQHDIVLIPSHPEYPEGLPMTIYEAYCSKTPLIASDHPMFEGKIIHKKTGMIFKAKNTLALTNTIMDLMSNPQLYQNLSENSKRAWENLQCSVKWNEFLERWIQNRSEDLEWLQHHSLINYKNESLIQFD